MKFSYELKSTKAACCWGLILGMTIMKHEKEFGIRGNGIYEIILDEHRSGSISGT